MSNVNIAPGRFDWERVTSAMTWATELHARQIRKGTTDIPYISHPLGVASLVIEDQGSEIETIAALLHDVIEDQDVRPEEIERRFGPDVRRIVEACTDSLDGQDRGEATWRPRKEAYIAHLVHARADEARVSLADKVHNAHAILRDYRRDGEGIWERFNGKRDGTLWYYRMLVDAFTSIPVASPSLLDDLRLTVALFATPAARGRTP